MRLQRLQGFGGSEIRIQESRFRVSGFGYRVAEVEEEVLPLVLVVQIDAKRE